MKKRILIIVQNLANGGAEHMAAETSRAFSDDYNVMIVTFRPEIDFEYGGTYRCLYAAGKGIIGKGISTFARLYKIKKIKREFKPDCSISFMPNADFPNVFTKNSEIEVSSVRANPEYNLKKGSLAYIIRRTTLRRSDIIVTPSIGIRDAACDFYNLGDKDIRTIYNVCDSDQDCAEHAEGSNRCAYVYTIGRLSKGKGQWHILKAFSLVHELYPDIKLKIIGKGDMENALKRLAYDLGISNNVIFTGFLKNPVSELEYGNIFVFSSAREGFPNVLVEAMSAGQACISADCNYGPREILNGENSAPVDRRVDAAYGILIPQFSEIEPNYTTDINSDERCLATIICDLIEDDQLRKHYCKEGRKRAEFFSFERYRSEWRRLVEDAYDRVMKNQMWKNKI